MENRVKSIDEVAYTLILSRDLHTRLKTMCASQTISIKDYLTALIELDLDNKILSLRNIKK